MGKKKGGILYSKWAAHKEFLAHPLKNIKWTTFLAIIFLDALFYLSLFGIVQFSKLKVQAKSATITLPGELRELSQAQAAALLPEVKGYYYFIILTTILTVLAVILFWSFFKGVIWALVTKTKMSTRYFRSFFLFNIPWLMMWVIIFTIFLLFYQPPPGQLALPVVVDSFLDVIIFPVSVLILEVTFIMKNLFLLLPVALFIMLTNTIYTLYPHHPEWKTVRRGVKLGLTHLIHLLIFHFVLFYCYLFVYLSTSEIAQALPLILGQIGASFLILAYFAVARYYIAAIIPTLERKV